jgi:Putative transposase
VLGYLSRYTHRVAISNRRLVAADAGGVSFRWKVLAPLRRVKWVVPNASAPIGPRFIATMPATTSTNILATVRMLRRPAT